MKTLRKDDAPTIGDYFNQSKMRKILIVGIKPNIPDLNSEPCSDYEGEEKGKIIEHRFYHYKKRSNVHMRYKKIHYFRRVWLSGLEHRKSEIRRNVVIIFDGFPMEFQKCIFCQKFIGKTPIINLSELVPSEM